MQDPGPWALLEARIRVGGQGQNRTADTTISEAKEGANPAKNGLRQMPVAGSMIGWTDLDGGAATAASLGAPTVGIRQGRWRGTDGPPWRVCCGTSMHDGVKLWPADGAPYLGLTGIRYDRVGDAGGGMTEVRDLPALPPSQAMIRATPPDRHDWRS
jgi:hypothetical protein